MGTATHWLSGANPWRGGNVHGPGQNSRNCKLANTNIGQTSLILFGLLQFLSTIYLSILPHHKASKWVVSWLCHRNGLLPFLCYLFHPPLFPFHFSLLYCIRTDHCLLICIDSWCTIVTHPRIPVLGPEGCTMTHGLTPWLLLCMYICYRLRVLNYKYPVVAVVGP